MKKLSYSLLLALIGACFLRLYALADELPPKLLEEQATEFGVSGDMGFGGSTLYSKPKLGYYDDMRKYELLDWDTKFQLLYLTKEYSLTMDYLISYDGKQERVSFGEIEPLYYRYAVDAPSDLRYKENPEADQTLFYPFVPEEYQYLKDSGSTVEIRYLLCVEDKETGEKAEKVFHIAWFYGEKAAAQTAYPEIPDGCRLVRIKEKDTLWSIAKEYLSDPFRYQEIYELNRDSIANPNRIYERQVIYLPMEK